jgi:hypothetical protein
MLFTELKLFIHVIELIFHDNSCFEIETINLLIEMIRSTFLPFVHVSDSEISTFLPSVHASDSETSQDFSGDWRTRFSELAFSQSEESLSQEKMSRLIAI